MKNIMIIVLVIFSILFFSNNCFAVQLSKDQIETLMYAEVAGEEIGYPETIQAIAWQETHAGDFLKVGNSGELGIFQIKYKTAKYILKKNGLEHIFTQDQIIYNLLFNKKFSSDIAKLYFKYLINKYDGQKYSWSKAVLAYNVGPTSVAKNGLSYDPNNYVKHIRENIHMIRNIFGKELCETNL